MLSENQTQWIFETCKKIANKYIDKLPLNDDAHHEFYKDTKEIVKNARHDELTVQLLVGIGNYLGKESERLRKESGYYESKGSC